MYDVARKDTFDSLSMWLQEVQQFSMGGGEQVVKLLVGNKIDQERAVSREVSKHTMSLAGKLSFFYIYKYVVPYKYSLTSYIYPYFCFIKKKLIFRWRKNGRRARVCCF